MEQAKTRPHHKINSTVNRSSIFGIFTLSYRFLILTQAVIIE